MYFSVVFTEIIIIARFFVPRLCKNDGLNNFVRMTQIFLFFVARLYKNDEMKNTIENMGQSQTMHTEKKNP